MKKYKGRMKKGKGQYSEREGRRKIKKEKENGR